MRDYQTIGKTAVETIAKKLGIDHVTKKLVAFACDNEPIFVVALGIVSIAVVAFFALWTRERRRRTHHESEENPPPPSRAVPAVNREATSESTLPNLDSLRSNLPWAERRRSTIDDRTRANRARALDRFSADSEDGNVDGGGTLIACLRPVNRLTSRRLRRPRLHSSPPALRTNHGRYVNQDAYEVPNTSTPREDNNLIQLDVREVPTPMEGELANEFRRFADGLHNRSTLPNPFYAGST